MCATDTTSVDPKIIDLINERQTDGGIVTSLEYFPPRSEEGVKVGISKMWTTDFRM